MRFLPCLFLFLTVAAAAIEKKSILGIYAEQGDTVRQGTGFWLDNQGTFVTAYHVVAQARSIRVFSDSNTLEPAAVRVVRLDPAHDLAVLHVTGASGARAVSLAESAPAAGDEIRVLAHPRGFPNQLFIGHTTGEADDSTKLSSANGSAIFQTAFRIIPVDLTVYGGMSGAPVFNQDEKVVGVIQGSLREGGGLAWILPTAYLRNLPTLPAVNRAPADITDWPPLLGNVAELRSLSARYATDSNRVKEVADFLANVRRFTVASDELRPAAINLRSALSFYGNLFTPAQWEQLGQENPVHAASARFARALRDKQTLRETLLSGVARFEPRLTGGNLPENKAQALARVLEQLQLKLGEYRTESAEAVMGIDTAALLGDLDSGNNRPEIDEAIRRLDEDFFAGLSPGPQRLNAEKGYFAVWAGLATQLREFLYYTGDN